MRIAVCLPESGNFGWGVCGRYLRQELAKLSETHEITTNDDLPRCWNIPVIQGIQGVNCLPLNPWNFGTYNVGYGFIENDIQFSKYVTNARRFHQAIACGSTWMKDSLEASVRSMKLSVAVQGVDFGIFQPTLKRRNSERFTIYSGGKFEYRKGQDLVIKAVAHMQQKYRDVWLVCNWHNPWPHSIETMYASPHIKFRGQALDAMAEGGIDMQRWSGAVSFSVRHEHLPASINCCDVALFPNRCEAGTNLALMEAMACGVPAIATYATGHKDVMAVDDLALMGGKEFVYEAHGERLGNWHEPDLDEIIATLEIRYRDRNSLPQIGEKQRQHIQKFTWEATAKSLMDVLMNTE